MNPNPPMPLLHTLLSLLLIFTLALPSLAFARPSLRILRNNGKEQADMAKDANLKNIKDGLQTVYERREHPRSNMSAEVPKDWELHLPEKRSQWLGFAEDMAVYFDDVGDERIFLGFGSKHKGKTVTVEDVEREFTSLVQGRGDDFLPVLHEYKHISSEAISVGGMLGKAHTYSYAMGGLRWQEQVIRIPYETRMIVLVYRSPANVYSQQLVHFQRFIDTLHWALSSSDARPQIRKKRAVSLSSALSSTYKSSIRNTSASSKASSRSSGH